MTARIVGHGEVSKRERITAANDISYDCYRIEYDEASTLALANGRFEVSRHGMVRARGQPLRPARCSASTRLAAGAIDEREPF